MSGRSFWQAVVNLSEGAQKFHSAANITSPYDGDPLELTLYVPCRNAASTIMATLDTIVEALQGANKSYEIIVIDDDSKDNSVELVRGFIAQHQELNVVLVHNHKPAGPAENYLSAAFIGRGKYFRQVNSDNREPAKSLTDIFKALGDADIIVPYCLPEMNEGASQLRIGPLTRVLNLLTHNRLNYYNGQPVHLRYNVLRWQASTQGSAFPTAILCRLLELGFTCKQVPCRMRERPYPVTWRDWLSLLHVLAGLMVRRISNLLRK